jgi:hypothetical protein
LECTQLEKVLAGIPDVDLSDFLWILDRKEKSQALDVSKCPIGLVCLFLSGGVEGTGVVRNPDAFRLTA